MDIPSSAYPAIGAITAAVVAGGISFIVTMLAKEQKTSEFRQAWIDGLRDDLSDFISTVDTLCSYLRLKGSRGHSPAELLAFLEERSPDIHRMGVSYNRILLRLNPREHKRLGTLLKELLAVMSSSEKALDEKHVDQVTQAVVGEAQSILKAEWRRVKRGEPVFRTTKYACLALFLLALAFAVAVGRGYVVIAWRA
jgi:hypothetical protein